MEMKITIEITGGNKDALALLQFLTSQTKKAVDDTIDVTDGDTKKQLEAAPAKKARGRPAKAVKEEEEAPKRKSKKVKEEEPEEEEVDEEEVDEEEVDEEQSEGDDDDSSEEDGEEEDARPAKKKKAKKEEEEEDETPRKKAKKGDAKLSLEGDMLPAFKEYTERHSRDKALALLKKFNVKSIRKADPDVWPELLKALQK